MSTVIRPKKFVYFLSDTLLGHMMADDTAWPFNIDGLTVDETAARLTVQYLDFSLVKIH